MELLTLLVFHSIAPLGTKIEHGNTVVNDSVFDLVVKRTVSLERRHLIDFNQGRFQLMIDHDIKT